MNIPKTRRSSIILLSILILLASSMMYLQPTVATPNATPDTHLAITVMPDSSLHLTTWLNTVATNNLVNGSSSTSFQVGETSASVNASITLEDALFAEYPFNVTEGELTVTLSNDETTLTLDLDTVAPPSHLLTELIPDAELVDLLTLALNSTDFALEVGYQSDTVEISVDATVTANLTALLSDALGFPFAISTPLLLHVDYSDAEYSGNLSVVVVPGLPIDITLALTGNASDLCIQGNLYVPYGTYPEIGLIDESTLDDLEIYLEDVFPDSQTVEGSLQNLSDGTLTSPNSAIDREVIYDGEYLNFTLCLHAVSGDLFGTISDGVALTDVIGMDIPRDALEASENPMDAAALTLEYYPDATALNVQVSGRLSNLTLPIEDLLSLILSLLEDFPESSETLFPPLPTLEAANFSLSYTSFNKRLQLHLATTLTEYDGFRSLITPLEGMLPSMIAPIVSAPEASLTGLESIITYNASIITSSLTVLWNGDVNQDVNRLKNVLLAEFTHLSGDNHATLNATDLKVTGITGQLTVDPITLTGFVTGFSLKPPIHPMTPTMFQLTAFFNAAQSVMSDTSIPTLTLMGGCNGTHTITLVPDTSTPAPLTTLHAPQSSIVLMTWRNVTLNDLQNVTFHLIEGTHYSDIVVNPALISLTSPHVIDASRLGTTVIITELSDPVALTLSTITSQQALPAPASNAVALLETPIQITPSMTPDALMYTLQMTYTDQQILDAGVDEATLTIQYWNTTTETWTSLPSIVDTEANVVEATLTHFSIFTLVGTELTLWTQPWFLVLLAGGGTSTVGLGLSLWRRRTQTQP
jgi:hypothetical protein